MTPKQHAVDAVNQIEEVLEDEPLRFPRAKAIDLVTVVIQEAIEADKAETKTSEMKSSHYDYLNKHLAGFFIRLGVRPREADGMIRAHGDKCYGYRERWATASIPFAHGVAVYLLSYLHPYSVNCRETAHGWVHPDRWVVENYDRFREFLPEVTEG